MRSVVLFLKTALYILNSQVKALEWCYFCNASKKCEPPFEKIHCDQSYPKDDYYNNDKPTWACYTMRFVNSRRNGFLGGRPLQERNCIDTSSKLHDNIQKFCKNSSPILCTICNNSDLCNSEILKRFNTNGAPLGVDECKACSDPICFGEYDMTCVGSHLVKYFCAIYKKPGQEIRTCEYSDSSYKKTCQEFKKKGGACKKCEKDRCNTHLDLDEKKPKKAGCSTFKSLRFLMMVHFIFVGLLAFF